MIKRLLKVSFYIALVLFILILGFVSHKYKIKIMFSPFNYIVQYTQDIFEINFEKIGDRSMRPLDEWPHFNQQVTFEKNSNFNIYNKPKNDFEIFAIFEK